MNATVTEFPTFFVIAEMTGFVPRTKTFKDASEKTSPAGFLATIEMLYAVVFVNPVIVIDEPDEDASNNTEEPFNE